jgi:DNA mismatch repair protein MutS
VHGYYIEISRQQAQNLPEHYHRRQTLKNTERYITDELKAFEDKALSSKERALAHEKILYNQILDDLMEPLTKLHRMSEQLAYMDCTQNLAERAQTLNWKKPQITPKSGINIVQGRHPIVEAYQEHAFTPNDTALFKSKHLMVITGPNMGGKSTYMRQTALITLLAHTGSFVPAKSATIGIIDKLFTRIGASDNLAKGQSTFMVEMHETAHILTQATENSLVLIDEIGRGTSTQDGSAIAQATAEHLCHTTKAYTMFSTHFFEITQLPNIYPEAFNRHFSAIETDYGIQFLHQCEDGPGNNSYGLAVAELAGLPKDLIKRAKKLVPQKEETC